ncbi:hypothetical protein C8Q79DRAFT_1104638 [Trametes meyenii]|nr:hypothetical protein C8Q79DRAFT_1104638 [Trametes meyenii]
MKAQSRNHRTRLLQKFIEDKQVVDTVLETVGAKCQDDSLVRHIVQPQMDFHSALLTLAYNFAVDRKSEASWYLFWELNFLQNISLFSVANNTLLAVMPHGQLPIQASVQSLKILMDDVRRDVERAIVMSKERREASQALEDMNLVINGLVKTARKKVLRIPDTSLMIHGATGISSFSHLHGLKSAASYFHGPYPVLHEAKVGCSRAALDTMITRVRREQVAWQCVTAFAENAQQNDIITIVTCGPYINCEIYSRDRVILPRSGDGEDLAEESSDEGGEECQPGTDTWDTCSYEGSADGNDGDDHADVPVIASRRTRTEKERGGPAQPRSGPFRLIADIERENQEKKERTTALPTLAISDDTPANESGSDLGNVDLSQLRLGSCETTATDAGVPKAPQTAEKTASDKYLLNVFSDNRCVHATSEKKMEQVFRHVRTKMVELYPGLSESGQPMSFKETLAYNVRSGLANAFSGDNDHSDLRSEIQKMMRGLFETLLSDPQVAKV